MKRWMIRIVLLLLMGTAGFCLGRRIPSHPSSDRTSSRGPTVQQIQQLSTLVTTRVETADVQETSVEGYTGSMRVALLVKGDFLLGVNLAQAHFESVDHETLSAVLTLPAPQVTSPRVDHQRTRLFEITNEGLWAMVPTDAGRSKVVERAYEQAQQSVTTLASDPLLIDRSRRQAEQVICAFFQALGWSVRICWQA
jgi:hypothetical protein